MILVGMAEVRRIVSLALEARAQSGIKVRQPLGKLMIKGAALRDKTELISLIADEVNVKRVVFDLVGQEVFLDTEITPELRSEGRFRELVRHVQDLRKKEGLSPDDMIVLTIATTEDGDVLVRAFEAELKKICIVRELIIVALVKQTEGVVNIGGVSFVVILTR
jgi:isoleucyl-tRNA synthetase